jgi:hypothetical protein
VRGGPRRPPPLPSRSLLVLDTCQVICTEKRGIVHALEGDFKAPSSLPNVILLLLILVLCVCSASFLEEFFSETGRPGQAVKTLASS